MAVEIDVEQRLRMLDSWDGVTEESTVYLFLEELKDKNINSKKLELAISFLSRVRQQLSSFRSYSVEVLNNEFEFLYLPSMNSMFFDMFKRNLKVFLSFLRDFGGEKQFQNEHLQKFFQALKMYIHIFSSFNNNQPVSLKIYSDLLYISHENLFNTLLNKIQNRIEKYKIGIDKSRTLVIAIFLSYTHSLIAPNSLYDRETNKDAILDIFEDSENYEEAENLAYKYFSQISGIKDFRVINPQGTKFFDALKKFYTDSRFEKRKILMRELSKLKTDKEFTREMAENISRALKIG